jgi:hypothetical protein
MQWGGPARQWNAASATDAQELYQTIVEDAVNYVVAHPPIGTNPTLADFRIKHTAYLYPGTHVAKYMRIKVMVRNAAGNWVKAIDQSTKDDAAHLSGGRATPTSPRGRKQIAFENQLTTALANTGAAVLPTKRATAAATVLSSAAATTPDRPVAPVAPPAASSWSCFITTACVEARGLPDDCEELTLLRAFRDGFMRSQPRGEELIQEYYRIAPRIVSKIQESDACSAVLERLYRELVLRSVELIRRGRNEEALENYCAHVRQLSEQYPEDDGAVSETDSSPLLAGEGELVFQS